VDGGFIGEVERERGGERGGGFKNIRMQLVSSSSSNSSGSTYAMVV
jgi:hypothetical protein